MLKNANIKKLLGNYSSYGRGRCQNGRRITNTIGQKIIRQKLKKELNSSLKDVDEILTLNNNAPIAQLDKAFDYESKD